MNEIPQLVDAPHSVQTKLLSLVLSMNAIKQEYNKLIRPYENAINKLQKSISENIGHPIIVRNLNKTLRHLMYLQAKVSFNDIPEAVFAGVIKFLPVKYVSYEKEVQSWYGDFTHKGQYSYYAGEQHIQRKLNITLLKINIKAIAWLEQQDELNRIELTREERALMVAMKEAMTVHDDNVTFDSYIEDWAHKILKELDINYISSKNYAKVMRERYKEQRKKERSEQDKVVEQVMRVMEHNDKVRKKVEEIIDGN